MEKKHNKKLNLDFSMVETARNLARKIALDIQGFINDYTTTTIERTVCRLFGVDGIDGFGVPIPNIVVNNIVKDKALGKGVALFVGNAMLQTNLTPQEIGEKIAKKSLDLIDLPLTDLTEIKAVTKTKARETLIIIEINKFDFLIS